MTRPIRTLLLPALLAAALATALAACGDGAVTGTPEVGDCTTADPAQLVNANVTAVDCDAEDAKSKITREAENAEACDGASVTFEGDVFCVQSLDPEFADQKPDVGDCTTADPSESFALQVQVVACESDKAKSRITEEASEAGQCEEAEVTFGQQRFCIEAT